MVLMISSSINWCHTVQADLVCDGMVNFVADFWDWTLLAVFFAGMRVSLFFNLICSQTTTDFRSILGVKRPKHYKNGNLSCWSLLVLNSLYLLYMSMLNLFASIDSLFFSNSLRIRVTDERCLTNNNYLLHLFMIKQA